MAILQKQVIGNVSIKSYKPVSHWKANTDLKVFTLGLDPVRMIFEQDVQNDSLIRSYLENKIDIFNTSLGYQTDVEVDDVIDVIQKSLQLWSYLITLHRQQNSRQMIDAFGRDISSVFNKVPEIRKEAVEPFTWRIPNFGDIWTDPNRPYRMLDLGVENYSNVAWLNLVTKALAVIHLPINILMTYQYLFGNHFVNMENSDEARNVLIRFAPIASQSTTLKEQKWADNLGDRITSLTTELSEKFSVGAIKQFMYELEYYSEIAQSFDLTRDIYARTLPVIQDDELIRNLETSSGIIDSILTSYNYSKGFNGKNLNHINLMYSDPRDYYDVFDATYSVNYDVPTLATTMLFSTKSRGNQLEEVIPVWWPSVGIGISTAASTPKIVKLQPSFNYSTFVDTATSNPELLVNRLAKLMVHEGLNDQDYVPSDSVLAVPIQVRVDIIPSSIFEEGKDLFKYPRVVPYNNVDIEPTYNLFTINSDDYNQLMEEYLTYILFQDALAVLDTPQPRITSKSRKK